MNLEWLRVFVDVAYRGNFAAVARERNIDPSSVSRTIAELEADLGMRLFQRTTRKLTLTEAGERYLAGIEPVLDELKRAQEEASATVHSPRGTLRLSASATFGLRCIVPLLAEFREGYPELRLEGQFTDDNVDLVAERVDLAIRLSPQIEGNYVATRLMRTCYRVVANPDYLARSPALVIPSDLKAHRCILLAVHAYQRRWVFKDKMGELTEVPIEGDLVLSPAASVHVAALSGMGPALLPDWLVDTDISAGRLIDLFPSHAVAATSFDTSAWLIYPSRAFLPHKVRVMIDFLKRKLEKGKGNDSKI